MEKRTLIGQRFRRLIVICETDKGRKRGTNWLCKCDCGRETIATTTDLLSGHKGSCGCYKMDRISEAKRTHGKTNSRLYHIWEGIKQRTLNSHSKDYPRYGGRGITVCDEWANNFQAFYDWATKCGYADGLTLDRIQNEGNYEPSNCRWVTQKKQGNNRRTNKFIEYNGERKTMKEWADAIGMSYEVLTYRIKAGWDIEKAFTAPINKKRRKNEG